MAAASFPENAMRTDKRKRGTIRLTLGRAPRGVHLGPFHRRRHRRRGKAAPLFVVITTDAPLTTKQTDASSVLSDASCALVPLQSMVSKKHENK